MGKEPKAPEKVVYVCTGSKCKKKGGKAIQKGVRGFIKDNRDNFKRVSVIKTGCTDRCKFGPVVCLQPDNSWHFFMDEIRAINLINEKWGTHPSPTSSEKEEEDDIESEQ